MLEVDRLPLFLAPTWDAAHDRTRDAAARLATLVHFAEALCELLAVSFVATLLADRGLADERSTTRLASAAARAYGKGTSFGDWQQLVQSGFRAEGRLVRACTGGAAEPRFDAESHVAEALSLLERPVSEPVGLCVFLERLVWLRNELNHGRGTSLAPETLTDALSNALAEAYLAMPGLQRRALCHVERAAVSRDGFVVHYRHLIGTGLRGQREHRLPEVPTPSPWRSDQLVLWDGEAPQATPVPVFLARFSRAGHALRFCQGTSKAGREDLVFHSWQEGVAAETVDGLAPELWAALKSLEKPVRPPPAGSPQGARSGETIYRRAFHRALTNDGVISADERAMLDTVAHGIGLSDELRAGIERDVTKAWSDAGKPLDRDLPPGEPSMPPVPLAAVMAASPSSVGRVAWPVDQAAPGGQAGPTEGTQTSRVPVFVAVFAGLLVVAVAVGVAIRRDRGDDASPPLQAPAAAFVEAAGNAGQGEACRDVTDCEGELNCDGSRCVAFPRGRGGDAARAYKEFARRRNAGDRAGFEALIASPIPCWFYVRDYPTAKFVDKRLPSPGSTSKHVIHELLIVSESGLRVTLQDRGHIGNACHDTAILMENTDRGWLFAGEGSQRKESQRGKPLPTDCWELFGGPAAEARFGRYCPPVP